MQPLWMVPMAPPLTIDIAANRRAVKWSRTEQVWRVLFALARPLVRYSPRPLWGWRRLVLRVFGARIGAEVRIAPSASLTMPWNLVIGARAAIGEGATLYALGQIEIGADATVSQGAHLCAGTHDFRDPAMPLLKPAIRVGEGAWVCADAAVGPGVGVGELAVVGARAVVMRDVAPRVIVAGNPARIIGERRIFGPASTKAALRATTQESAA